MQDWQSEFRRLEGAYAPATVRCCYTDVQAFINWCDANGHTALPASVETVCAFLSEQAQDRTPSTIRRRLYAIRKVHQLLNLPNPTFDEEINLTQRRIRRQKLTRPNQAAGMTREYLDRFLAVQPDDPWGWRNKALLSLGYDILARRSELVALKTDDVVFRADGTLRVLIRRSKADPFGRGRIAFTSKRTGNLLGAWLDWRGDGIEPLFCPIYRHKAIDRSISTTTVKRVVKDAAQAVGLPADQRESFSGHSMRVGAAQDLLCAGHDTAAIMRAGGWKSLPVLSRYLEAAEHNVWS
jgi:site-specific recombinase XerD